MDLNQLFTLDLSDKGVDMEILHPSTGAVITSDDGKPWVITVAGTDSDLFRNGRNAIQRRRGADNSGDGAAELFANVVVGWKNLVLNKEPLKYSKDAAKKLLTDFPWLRDQVAAFASDRGNFLPKA